MKHESKCPKQTYTDLLRSLSENRCYLAHKTELRLFCIPPRQHFGMTEEKNHEPIKSHWSTFFLSFYCHRKMAECKKSSNLLSKLFPKDILKCLLHRTFFPKLLLFAIYYPEVYKLCLLFRPLVP